LLKMIYENGLLTLVAGYIYYNYLLRIVATSVKDGGQAAVN
jgi:hypothetical protein